MWEVYEVTNPVARKEYNCDAYDHLQLSIGLCKSEFQPGDWEILMKAKQENFKILPGVKYLKCKGIYDGEPTTFRARFDIDTICKDYDIYDD